MVHATLYEPGYQSKLIELHIDTAKRNILFSINKTQVVYTYGVEAVGTRDVDVYKSVLFKIQGSVHGDTTRVSAYDEQVARHIKHYPLILRVKP